MTPIPPLARSRHSLGFGTASVEALAGRAARLGLPALALVDLETLAGQIRFHDACAEAGVRPITGVELRAGHGRHDVGTRAGRLILLARDGVGFANLCRIVSRRSSRPVSRPAPDPVADLGGDTDGLFLLADDADVVGRLVRTDAVDPEAVRFLIARPTEVRTVRPPAGVPLVAGPAPVGLEPADRSLHALLLAIRHRTTVDDVRAAGLDAEGRTALTPDALANFDDLPEAVAESRRIADACRLDLRTRNPIPPRLPGFTAADAVDELRSRCSRGLARARSAGRLTGRAYAGRLQRELGTIERLGFADLFVAVAEIVRGARELRVETAGRGSVAGSLVAHLLGITDVDPVASGLLFERFLHEHRPEPPDIDLDVASTGREALRAWTVRRFGRERVAGVATYATFRARGAVRAGLAALGVARADVERTVRALDPGDASGEAEAALVEAALARSPVAAVRDAAPLVRRLVGLPSHLGAHPGGLVIGDGPLAERVPLGRTSSGAIVTQYDGRGVERAGLRKIDLLGNHFLSELGAVRAVDPSLGAVPADDPATWATLDRADTVGLFQVESPAVRSVLGRLPVRDMGDLVAALAVVRPGAAAGAAKARYVRRARGEEPWDPLEILGGWDPPDGGELRERLERTRGVLLYDEDIIRLLAAVGGMDLATADALRSAIVAAGESPSALARLGEGFAAAARAAGAPRDVARRAWEAATRFAAYSFAQAHAASYALLAWRAAWLRTHAPVELAAALIDHHRALYPLRTTAAAVARWGVTLLPPDVQRSGLASAPEGGDAVRVGLAALKGLTRRTAQDLLAGRPFRDLGEVLEHARPSRPELRALLLSGACDALPPLSAAGYPFVHEVVLRGLRGEAAPDALPEALEQVARRPAEGPEAARLEAYRALVRVRNELAFLDMHLSDHPIRLLRPEADRLGCVPTDELPQRVGRRVRVVALLAAAQGVPGAGGELRFLTLEDEHGLAEGVLFPDANARLGPRLSTPGPYLLGGTVRGTGGEAHLVVTEVAPFHERGAGPVTPP